MRGILLALAGIVLVSGTVQAGRLDPEASLAKELAGRMPGKPVDCIRQIDIQSSQIFDHTAILYKGSGGIYYVNRPRSGTEFLDSNDILVTDTHTNDLCSVDIVRLVDNGSHFQTGTVGLGQFVPYTKPK